VRRELGEIIRSRREIKRGRERKSDSRVRREIMREMRASRDRKKGQRVRENERGKGEV
jgi:hypothetical protein